MNADGKIWKIPEKNTKIPQLSVVVHKTVKKAKGAKVVTPFALRV